MVFRADLSVTTASHRCPGCLARWGAARLSAGSSDLLVIITPLGQEIEYPASAGPRLMKVAARHVGQVVADQPERQRHEH